MKVDKLILEEQDKLNVIQEIPVIKEELFTSVNPYKGHIMFEINCTTGTIEPATYQDISTNISNKEVRKKIITKPNCLYISCLNKKMAAKKYLKWAIENLVKQ